MDSRSATVYKALWLTFGIVPIVAGLDKFTEILTEWTQYLADPIAGLLPFSPETFMAIVGVIEIVAGVLVFVKPRLGGLVVAAWLVAIALNLLLAGYYDIAVRDLVMAVAAWGMSQLAVAHASAPAAV
ncbi:MAG TPA: hypothetical protein VHM02_04125, partial [Thermoanaerobaculia bacterium]|nr:hypothetical protein [Thermoanaerobaculia bacterium]